jgi:hypothetical protein
MTGQSPLNSAKPELRPYQREVMERFGAEVAAGRRRVLLVAPTAAQAWQHREPHPAGWRRRRPGGGSRKAVAWLSSPRSGKRSPAAARTRWPSLTRCAPTEKTTAPAGRSGPISQASRSMARPPWEIDSRSKGDAR